MMTLPVYTAQDTRRCVWGVKNCQQIGEGKSAHHNGLNPVRRRLYVARIENASASQNTFQVAVSDGTRQLQCGHTLSLSLA